MLEKLQDSAGLRPTTSFALKAMDIAVHQQKEFQRTAVEIRARQEQEEAERQRRAEEEAHRKAQQEGALRSHDSQSAVEVSVSSSSVGDLSAGSSGNANAGEQLGQRGFAVDVKA